jgi:hypothetical protein
MGKLLQGPFGAATGKIGNIVSYVLNGKNVFRRIGKSKHKPSKAQLASRQGFKAVNEFLHPLKGFINLGFMFEKGGTTQNQHNVATSYNMLNALKDDYPNIEIDYSKVIVSKGTLPAAATPTALTTSSNVTISWSYLSDRDFAFRNDRAMVLFFYPGTKSAIYFLSGAERSSGMQNFEIAENETNGKPMIYISFFAEDRLSVSDSTLITSVADNKKSTSVVNGAPVLCNSCFFNMI